MTPCENENPEYRLNTIYFYLTEGCNLRCRHCWIQPKYQGPGQTYPALEFELFRLIIQEARPLGLSAVKLTGGEPLLHPQIRQILDLIKAEELGLTVETNGTLCTPELAAQLKATSENPFISVSLDGVDAKTHEWVRGVAGCYEAALEGTRNLVEAGFKPQIIMTLMQRNKDQMEPMVRLAESLGAGSVKYNLLQPTARGERMHQAGATLTVEELVELGRWVENGLAASTELRLVYSHPGGFRPLGKLFAERGGDCRGCDILRILGVLADGSYCLCGIGETTPDLIFGQAGQDPLAEVWANNAILRDIRTGLPERLEGICGECLLKGRCWGSCVAQNYYRTQSLWAPFWYCETAHQAGLFPESRRASDQVATQVA